MISIKSEAELRHALAHIIYAIEALAEDPPCIHVAQMEVDSIKELIFWGNDSNEALEAYFTEKEQDDGEELQRKKDVQGKEDLQRKVRQRDQGADGHHEDEGKAVVEGASSTEAGPSDIADRRYHMHQWQLELLGIALSDEALRMQRAKRDLWEHFDIDLDAVWRK